jgi:putative ABC transport system substrate-binding protein
VPAKARIGWLTAQRPPSLAPYVKAYREALAELGWVEERNLTIEFRYGDDDLARVPALANELVALPVDLIVAQGAAVYEVSRLGLRLPVVYVYSGDPVAAGLAQSLSKPLFNMTGLTFMAAELNSKRLELLTEMVPRLRRVALLANPEHPGEIRERSVSEEAARNLGLQVRYEPTRTPQELEAALRRMADDPPQAISLFADGFAVQNRERIIGFGMQHRAPVISGWPVFADSGAVASFGPRLVDSYQRLAAYTDRVLKGARPSDLPIEQPTTFETIINLKTAQLLGLRIPEPVLLRADRLIR